MLNCIFPGKTIPPTMVLAQIIRMGKNPDTVAKLENDLTREITLFRTLSLTDIDSSIERQCINFERLVEWSKDPLVTVNMRN